MLPLKKLPNQICQIFRAKPVHQRSQNISTKCSRNHQLLQPVPQYRLMPWVQTKNWQSIFIVNILGKHNDQKTWPPLEMAISRHSGRQVYSDFGTMVRYRLEVHGIHHLSDISTIATPNMEPPSHIQIFLLSQYHIQTTICI